MLPEGGGEAAHIDEWSPSGNDFEHLLIVGRTVSAGLIPKLRTALVEAGTAPKISIFKTTSLKPRWSENLPDV